MVNNSLPPAVLQPPIPQQASGPPSFVPGTMVPAVPPPIPVPMLISQRASSNTANFSYAGNSQLWPKKELSIPNAADSAQKDVSGMSNSGSSPVHTSATSTTVSTTSSFSQAAASISSASSFHSPSVVPGAPVTPGLPAVPGSSVLCTPTVSSATMGSFSPAVLRPVLPPPVPPHPTFQPQVYPPFPAIPSGGVPPQAHWLQTPQISGLRPPFIPCPPVYPGPFALAARVVSLPSVPLPDAQPPGITPIGNPGGVLPPSVTSAIQMTWSSGVQPEVSPPGTDDRNRANDAGTKDDTVKNEQLDAWSAHRTATGVVYYYNSITGESTYEKPSGFKGEAGKAAEQPTPVAWEMVTGTDWALVTTNDGKKYYYNTKTEVSSWQVPAEVAELRKKLEADTLKESSMPVPNSDAPNEKVTSTANLSAPALNTGGRDAIALRTSGAPGSSSALDLVKKKLQESGAQVTSFPTTASSGSALLETNGSKSVEATVKGLQSEGSKDKPKDADGEGNISDSSSDSEDEDTGPTKEERILQFKEMLKERGVAPFSKWDKELPKIVFDPRFKAIPTYAERRSLFEHYVRTRAEEERKEKRAAQRAAVEGFKQLLEEAKEDIDHNTDYHAFRKKWGHDPRFEALDRKEREVLLNERVLSLKRAAEEKAQAERAAAASNFKAMLLEKGTITASSRWSRVKDGFRDDQRYKAVKHEERETLFNEYISELKAAEDEAERATKAKREEQEKLKERERELRKRKEREEQEMERIKLKVRRKEAAASYQALLVETIKDPQASWTESKPKLEKDPQGRASNPDLDEADLEKLFREHVKMLYERCAHEFRALLTELVTPEAAAKETEDRKTILTSWSTAKKLLKSDPRYTKVPRKDREALWKRHAEELLRRQKVIVEQKGDKHDESKNRSSNDPSRNSSASRSAQERR